MPSLPSPRDVWSPASPWSIPATTSPVRPVVILATIQWAAWGSPPFRSIFSSTCAAGWGCGDRWVINETLGPSPVRSMQRSGCAPSPPDFVIEASVRSVLPWSLCRNSVGCQGCYYALFQRYRVLHAGSPCSATTWSAIRDNRSLTDDHGLIILGGVVSWSCVSCHDIWQRRRKGLRVAGLPAQQAGVLTSGILIVARLVGNPGPRVGQRFLRDASLARRSGEPVSSP